jgi:hypothetical protein
MEASVDRAVLAVLNVRLDRIGGRVQPPSPDQGDWLVEIELPGEPTEMIRGATATAALASASAWVEGFLRDRGV